MWIDSFVLIRRKVKHVCFHTLDVENLLASPILIRENIDFKFKRTNELADRSNFVLKTLINNEQDKVDVGRIKLYTNLLVGNQVSCKLVDLSSTNEQIILVLCDSVIGEDFFLSFVQVSILIFLSE